MKRLQKTTLRQPELMSLAVVSVFKKVVVHKIFDMSENIFDENKIKSFEDFQYGRNLAHSLVSILRKS